MVELELSEERIISCCILPQGMKLNVEILQRLNAWDNQVQTSLEKEGSIAYS